MFYDFTNDYRVIGRITRDIEVKTTSSGFKIGQFSIVHNNRRKNKSSGEWEDNASFFDVKVLGDKCDYVVNNFGKGTIVGIQASLEQETWDDKATGQKRSRVVLIVNDIRKIYGNKPENSGEIVPTTGNSAPAGKKAASTRKPANTVPVPEDATPEGGPDEDIPF